MPENVLKNLLTVGGRLFFAGVFFFSDRVSKESANLGNARMPHCFRNNNSSSNFHLLWKVKHLLKREVQQERECQIYLRGIICIGEKNNPASTRVLTGKCGAAMIMPHLHNVRSRLGLLPILKYKTQDIQKKY